MPHPLAKLEAPPAVDVAIGGLVSSGSPCAVFIFFFSLLSSSDSSSTMSAWSSRRTWIVGCCTCGCESSHGGTVDKAEGDPS